MPEFEFASSAQHSRGRSRLGDLLLRMQRNLEQTREAETTAQQVFDTWQARWTERREQIAQRLELLDQQLSRLISNDPPRPQLSLMAVTMTDDDRFSADE